MRSYIQKYKSPEKLKGMDVSFLFLVSFRKINDHFRTFIWQCAFTGTIITFSLRQISLVIYIKLSLIWRLMYRQSHHMNVASSSSPAFLNQELWQCCVYKTYLRWLTTSLRPRWTKESLMCVCVREIKANSQVGKSQTKYTNYALTSCYEKDELSLSAEKEMGQI